MVYNLLFGQKTGVAYVSPFWKKACGLNRFFWKKRNFFFNFGVYQCENYCKNVKSVASNWFFSVKIGVAYKSVFKKWCGYVAYTVYGTRRY